MSQPFFTIGELAEHYHEPEWKIRRVVDAIDPHVARAGQYRLVPHDLLAAIGDKLQQPAAKPDK
jgi:hypothetical protein